MYDKAKTILQTQLKEIKIKLIDQKYDFLMRD